MDLCRCCKNAHRDLQAGTSSYTTTESDEELLNDTLVSELGESSLSWFDDLTETYLTSAEDGKGGASFMSQNASSCGWSPCPKGGVFTVHVGKGTAGDITPISAFLSSSSGNSSGLKFQRSRGVGSPTCDQLGDNNAEIKWSSSMATPFQPVSDSSFDLNETEGDWRDRSATRGIMTPSSDDVKPKVIHRQLFSPGQERSHSDSLSLVLEEVAGNNTLELEKTLTSEEEASTFVVVAPGMDLSGDAEISAKKMDLSEVEDVLHNVDKTVTPINESGDASENQNRTLVNVSAVFEPEESTTQQLKSKHGQGMTERTYDSREENRKSLQSKDSPEILQIMTNESQTPGANRLCFTQEKIKTKEEGKMSCVVANETDISKDINDNTNKDLVSAERGAIVTVKNEHNSHVERCDHIVNKGAAAHERDSPTGRPNRDETVLCEINFSEVQSVSESFRIREATENMMINVAVQQNETLFVMNSKVCDNLSCNREQTSSVKEPNVKTCSIENQSNALENSMFSAVYVDSDNCDRNDSQFSESLSATEMEMVEEQCGGEYLKTLCNDNGSSAVQSEFAPIIPERNFQKQNGLYDEEVSGQDINVSGTTNKDGDISGSETSQNTNHIEAMLSKIFASQDGTDKCVQNITKALETEVSESEDGEMLSLMDEIDRHKTDDNVKQPENSEKDANGGALELRVHNDVRQETSHSNASTIEKKSLIESDRPISATSCDTSQGQRNAAGTERISEGHMMCLGNDLVLEHSTLIEMEKEVLHSVKKGAVSILKDPRTPRSSVKKRVRFSIDSSDSSENFEDVSDHTEKDIARSKIGHMNSEYEQMHSSVSVTRELGSAERTKSGGSFVKELCDNQDKVGSVTDAEFVSDGMIVSEFDDDYSCTELDQDGFARTVTCDSLTSSQVEEPFCDNSKTLHSYDFETNSTNDLAVVQKCNPRVSDISTGSVPDNIQCFEDMTRDYDFNDSFEASPTFGSQMRQGVAGSLNNDCDRSMNDLKIKVSMEINKETTMSSQEKLIPISLVDKEITNDLNDEIHDEPQDEAQAPKLSQTAEATESGSCNKHAVDGSFSFDDEDDETVCAAVEMLENSGQLPVDKFSLDRADKQDAHSTNNNGFSEGPTKNVCDVSCYRAQVCSSGDNSAHNILQSVLNNALASMENHTDCKLKAGEEISNHPISISQTVAATLCQTSSAQTPNEQSHIHALQTDTPTTQGLSSRISVSPLVTKPEESQQLPRSSVASLSPHLTVAFSASALQQTPSTSASTPTSAPTSSTHSRFTPALGLLHRKQKKFIYPAAPQVKTTCPEMQEIKMGNMAVKTGDVTISNHNPVKKDNRKEEENVFTMEKELITSEDNLEDRCSKNERAKENNLISTGKRKSLEGKERIIDESEGVPPEKMPKLMGFVKFSDICMDPTVPNVQSPASSSPSIASQFNHVDATVKISHEDRGNDNGSSKMAFVFKTHSKTADSSIRTNINFALVSNDTCTHGRPDVSESSDQLQEPSDSLSANAGAVEKVKDQDKLYHSEENSEWSNEEDLTLSSQMWVQTEFSQLTKPAYMTDIAVIDSTSPQETKFNPERHRNMKVYPPNQNRHGQDSGSREGMSMTNITASASPSLQKVGDEINHINVGFAPASHFSLKPKQEPALGMSSEDVGFEDQLEKMFKHHKNVKNQKQQFTVPFKRVKTASTHQPGITVLDGGNTEKSGPVTDSKIENRKLASKLEQFDTLLLQMEGGIRPAESVGCSATTYENKSIDTGTVQRDDETMRVPKTSFTSEFDFKMSGISSKSELCDSAAFQSDFKSLPVPYDDCSTSKPEILKKSKHLLQKFKNSGNKTSNQYIQESVNGLTNDHTTMSISEGHLLSNGKNDFVDSSETVWGFTTAGGKNIILSDTSTKKAKMLWESVLAEEPASVLGPEVNERKEYNLERIFESKVRSVVGAPKSVQSNSCTKHEGQFKTPVPHDRGQNSVVDRRYKGFQPFKTPKFVVTSGRKATGAASVNKRSSGSNKLETSLSNSALSACAVSTIDTVERKADKEKLSNLKNRAVPCESLDKHNQNISDQVELNDDWEDDSNFRTLLDNHTIDSGCVKTVEKLTDHVTQDTRYDEKVDTSTYLAARKREVCESEEAPQQEGNLADVSDTGKRANKIVNSPMCSEFSTALGQNCEKVKDSMIDKEDISLIIRENSNSILPSPIVDEIVLSHRTSRLALAGSRCSKQPALDLEQAMLVQGQDDPKYGRLCADRSQSESKQRKKLTEASASGTHISCEQEKNVHDESEKATSKISGCETLNAPFYLGFATASGTRVTVSERAMEHAKQFLEKSENNLLTSPQKSTSKTNQLTENKEIKAYMHGIEKTCSNDENMSVNIAPFDKSFSTVLELSASTTVSEKAIKNIEQVCGDKEDEAVLSALNTGLNTSTNQQRDIPSLGKGFATASGTKVTVSEKAMKHARQFLQDTNMNMSTAPQEVQMKHCNNNSSAIQSFTGFSTAAGTTATVSEKAMQHAKQFLESIEDRADTHSPSDVTKSSENNSKGCSSHVQFSTVTGSAVCIAEKTTEHAKQFLETTGHKIEWHDLSVASKMIKSEPKGKSVSMGFSTASGTAVSVSDKAMKHARQVLENVGDKDKMNRQGQFVVTECSEKVPESISLCAGFMTAFGSKISMSEKAMNHAREFLPDSEDAVSDLHSVHVGVGAQRCRNNKARDSSSINSEDQDNKGGLTEHHSASVGFSTASGVSVKISEAALKRARVVLSSEEDEQCEINEEKGPGNFKKASEGVEPNDVPVDVISLAATMRTTPCLMDRGKVGSTREARLRRSWHAPLRANCEEVQFDRRNMNGKRLSALYSNPPTVETQTVPAATTKSSSSFKPPYKKARICGANSEPLTAEGNVLKESTGQRVNAVGFTPTTSSSSSSSLLSSRTSSRPIGSDVTIKKGPVFLSRKAQTNHKAMSVIDQIEKVAMEGCDLDDEDENKLLCQEPELGKKFHLQNHLSNSLDACQNSKDSQWNNSNSESVMGRTCNESGKDVQISSDPNTAGEMNLITPIDLQTNPQPIEETSYLEESVLEIERMRQEKMIRNKKKQRVRPIRGQWLQTRHKKQDLKTYKDLHLEPAIDLTREELVKSGMSKSVLAINGQNAKKFRFDLSRFFPALRSGYLIGDGALLVPDNHRFAGVSEFYRAFLTLAGVDPALVDERWIGNHYRWIVWKLAAYEVCFLHLLVGRSLTPQNVMLQLKYRYDREIDMCQRSALRKIVEKDDTPCKRMVLCIADVSKISDQQYAVEVTDGWYGLQAQLDSFLSGLVSKNRLGPGDKIVTWGAELVGCTEPCAPLEIKEGTRLKLSGNSTRPAPWHARLGYCFPPSALCVPLGSLHAGGGTVGVVDVVVSRKYPILYMERLPEGGCVFRTVEEEDKVRQQFEEKRQAQLEKVYSSLQAEMEDSKKGRKASCQKFSKKQIDQLGTGQEIAGALESAMNPEEVQESLSKSQLDRLMQYKQTEVDRKQQEMNRRMQQALTESGTGSRNVAPMQKFEVAGCGRSDIDDKQSCLLTVWRPGPEWGEVEEGKRYKLHNLAVSAARGRVEKSKVSLTATRQTYVEIKPIRDSLLDLVYEPRQVLTVAELKRKKAGDEFDFVGAVVQITVTQRPSGPTVVYASDRNKDILCIRIWSINQASNLKMRQCFVASSLTLSRAHHADKRRPPCTTADARSEFTIISASGHSSRYSDVFAEMEKLSKMPNFLQIMQARIGKDHHQQQLLFHRQPPEPVMSMFDSYNEDFPPEIIEKIFSPMSQGQPSVQHVRQQEAFVSAVVLDSGNSKAASLNHCASASSTNPTQNFHTSNDSGRERKNPFTENIVKNSNSISSGSSVLESNQCESELLKKRKLALREKMSKLLAYDRPSPLSPLPVRDSSAIGKKFKSPLPKKS